MRPILDPGVSLGLNDRTLRQAAEDYARLFGMRDQKSRDGKTYVMSGPNYVMQCLRNATFKDEFEFLVNDPDWGIKAHLPKRQLEDFEKRAKEMFAPREDGVYVKLLEQKLAITPDGKHIDGAIGTTVVGRRPIRVAPTLVEAPWSLMRRRALINAGLVKGFHGPNRTDRETILLPRLQVWPVYAGEADERMFGSRRPDELPEDAFPTLADGRMPGGVGANVTNISAEAAVEGLDTIVDKVDEGSTAANILLYDDTGTVPVDPDAGPNTNVLLGTLVCSDPAFGAASDDTPGAISALDTVTDDSSADATGTAETAFINATGTGADSHFSLNAGVSDEAFLMNTTAVVSGATLSVTSGSATLPQGSTAT